MNTNVHFLQTNRMPKDTQKLNSPFREKIFDLMKQQETSKILKLSSRIFQNKTANSSHSPFKQFSIQTEIIDESKIPRLDTSAGTLHYKSLQQKLGLNKTSNSKSNNKKQNSDSSQNSQKKKCDKAKKVSFIQNLGKTYYKPSQSKSRSKNKSKNNQSIQKSNSYRNLKKQSNSKNKLSKKSSVSQSFQGSSKNLKFNDSLNQSNNKNIFSSSSHILQSNDKQTQKKNYLLQTLKKMESVRKNLSKTFQQFDKQIYDDSHSKDNSISKNKSKQKSKSNLTVISDYVPQQSQSNSQYRLKSNKHKKSQSKFKKSSQKYTQSQSNIFHKKTPPKKFSSHVNKSSSLKKNTQPKIQNQLLKQLRGSCKNPQKWQTILRNDLISLHFRVVKRRLIELEIHAQNKLESLEIQLQKAHFICQSLKQNYVNVKKKEIITLLCSVRGVQLYEGNVDLFLTPKLFISIKTRFDETEVKFEKQVNLPYSWILLAEKLKKDKVYQSQQKKQNKQQLNNRIKTRSRLEGVELKRNEKLPHIIEIFSFCEIEGMPVSAKKQRIKAHHLMNKDSNSTSLSKFKDSYVYNFQLEDNTFKLFVNLKNFESMRKESIPSKTYDIELEGKGQALMNKIITYLENLG